AFTGYYGEGKTLGCLQFAKNLQRKHPHRNIQLYSNIHIVGQVKRITDWQELLNLPKNSIFIYDESQSDFSCNMGVNAFPEDLLRRLTQVRKKQFAVFATSPRFNRMNINFRESVNFVIECKNIMKLDRWFKYTFYHADDYEQYKDSKLKLMLYKYITMSFVVQNRDYRQYSTLEEVDTIKKDDMKLKKDDKLMLQGELKIFRNEVYKYIENEFKKVI
ncbi:MAG TPA: zonular occludens toxin domain-containing protein, partial [Candidatus Paceibacterota bacterium]